MPLSNIPRAIGLSAVVAIGALVGLPAAAAGPVSVTVNGSGINLNPAPSERAGRVFVPLRGVFENLGASVVYASGVINATGRGHTVSLRIGSQQATVDGQQQTVDVAPFIVGASTYVPLRFVSQALGATVNYDGSNNLVAISTNGNGNVSQAPPNDVITPVPGTNRGGNGAISMATTLPERGSHITSRTPTIEGTFSGGTVDPNTVHVMLDDLDVTNDAARNRHGFSYAPRSPLQSGAHVVRVSGTDSNGQAFRRGWDFWTP
ncbi:MAG: copper amine oxidase-like protein [Candidatus Eremiobacteraeota bacterium]|nr:copper amine oxidase-like protein [Candidatus Eremiobacteraeota bacterium]